jgi:hypothetical protein
MSAQAAGPAAQPPLLATPEAFLPAALLAAPPGHAAAPGSSFLSVPELEKAGVALVLAAEASGRLRQQHRFLYAAAGDLHVADVSTLLAEYKARPPIPITHAWLLCCAWWQCP